MAQLRLYIDEPFGVELKNTVYALDATTVDLCLSAFPWAPFRSTKAAVKLHTLLDLRGNIPIKAMQATDPEGHHSRIACPTLILTGTEDSAPQMGFPLQARIPDSELKVLPGAGHGCQMEQPWLFDRLMLELLARHGLFSAGPGRDISGARAA